MRAAAALLAAFAVSVPAVSAAARPAPPSALGTLFRVKDLTGFSLEFLKGADGKVDRLAVHADGNTIGPRKAVSPPR